MKTPDKERRALLITALALPFFLAVIGGMLVAIGVLGMR